MTYGPYLILAIFIALFVLAVRRIIRKGPCDQCHGGCGCGCGCGGKPPEASKSACPHCCR